MSFTHGIIFRAKRTIYQCDVEVEERDDWLTKSEHERAHKACLNNFSHRHVLALNFTKRLESGVSG